MYKLTLPPAALQKLWNFPTFWATLLITGGRKQLLGFSGEYMTRVGKITWGIGDTHTFIYYT